MKITLVPVRMDVPLAAELKGEVLVLNGVKVDLSAATAAEPLVPEAGQPWIVGPVRRVAGELVLDLLLPHGADAPAETRFPAPLTLKGDGALPLPAFDAAPREVADLQP